MISWIRRNPVAAYGALMVCLGAVITEGAASGLINATVLAWLGLAYGVLGALGASVAHKASTPLAAPRDAAGQMLVTLPTKVAMLHSAKSAADPTAASDGGSA